MHKKTVLFQGDSITDSFRNYEDFNSLGVGYPMLAAAGFHASNPTAKTEFLNRGISGNRVRDLRQRWQTDCVELNPDNVSILIGINDVWRGFDSNDPIDLGAFEEDYSFILNEIRQKLPETKIIILEPFLLHAPEDRSKWRPVLDPTIQSVRRLADNFADAFIPLDGLFAAAASVSSHEKWAADGVHPTPCGHALIAQNWLRVFEAL